MRQHFYILLVSLVFMGFAFRQDRRNGPDGALVSKNTSENALYANDEIMISNLHPNPADRYIRVSYNLPQDHSAKLVFYNILGSRMGEHFLPGDKKELVISTEELESGIYFHTLYINGKNLATKKLVIKH